MKRMKKDFFRKLIGFGMFVLMSIQPLAVSAGDILAEEDGNSTVRAEMEEESLAVEGGQAWNKFLASSNAAYTSARLQSNIGEVILANDANVVLKTWNEGKLGVNGTEAFCIQPLEHFSAGGCNAVDLLDFGMPQYYINVCALCQKYAYEYADLTANQKYLMAQLMVWRFLNGHYGWDCGNMHLDPSTLDISRQAEIVSEIYGKVVENGEKVYATGTAYVNGSSQALAKFELMENGYAKLQKASANTSITDGNNCYSLAGAQYGVYSDNACSAQVAMLETYADGNSNTVELAAGTYYVKEITAPTGYAKDVEVHTVTVAPNQTAVVKVTDEPLNDLAVIEINKIDAETGSAVTQGAASLAGAQFTVKFYAGYYTEDTLPEKAARTWVLETKKVNASNGEMKYYTRLSNTYKVSGDDFYYQDGIPTLPLGTITVEETKAPVGYLSDCAYLQADGSEEKIEGTYISQIKHDGDIVKLTGGNEYSVSDRVIRGDFEFTKRDEETQEAMAGIPFRLISNTTGESHIIVTDENGYYSSTADYNKHTNNTNANDKVTDGDYDASAGLWFGLDEGGENVAANDECGALPYDTYTLEELRCGKNAEKALYKGALTVSREGFDIDLGTIENADVTLQTMAKDEETNTHYVIADDEVTIVDTVSYTGLKKGQEYTMKGMLVQKSFGEPLRDSKGNPVSAEKKFTPKTAEGSVEMEFTFDASALAGEDIVVYEDVYLGTELIASHQDINDADQTIHFPGISTTAADAETKTNLSKADEEITVIDTVTYRNLQPGRKYTVTGALMDKETGEPALNEEGKEITSSVEIKPESSGGSVEVHFVFNGISLAGKTLVAFEQLTHGDHIYAVHADLEDENQTIYIPKIRTTATDQKTGKHEINASKQAVIVDCINYENMVPGLTYTVKGILMDQSADRPLLQNGQEITVETTFVHEKGNREVTVEFSLDASKLSGKKLTVFEEVYLGTELIAEHKDIQNEEQTVTVIRDTGSVKTGDDAWFGVLMALMAAAACVVIVILKTSVFFHQ